MERVDKATKAIKEKIEADRKAKIEKEKLDKEIKKNEDEHLSELGLKSSWLLEEDQQNDLDPENMGFLAKQQYNKEQKEIQEKLEK
jgi:hypothetical protein